MVPDGHQKQETGVADDTFIPNEEVLKMTLDLDTVEPAELWVAIVSAAIPPFLKSSYVPFTVDSLPLFRTFFFLIATTTLHG